MKLLFCLSIWGAMVYASLITPISAIDSKRMIDNGQAILVDVREAVETKDGMAKGAIFLPISKMNTDRQSFDKQVENFPKNKTIIVYCGTGKRSQTVGAELEKKGYKVLNMETFDSWKKAGLPIEKK